jgi:DNA-directed RNA polymerase specialized sigma24 family protein
VLPSSFSGDRWELDQETFQQLLGFLSSNPDEAGKRYEEIRLRLIKIFTCRGSKVPEELTDQTINRVARKVPEISKTYVGNPYLFFYGVARKIFLESVRKRPRPLPLPDQEPGEDKELKLDCLDQCMQKLTPRNRELILEYYQGEKGDKILRRRNLAGRLGVESNALRIRAHRIRNNLQKCVFECVEHNAGDEMK